MPNKDMRALVNLTKNVSAARDTLNQAVRAAHMAGLRVAVVVQESRSVGEHYGQPVVLTEVYLDMERVTWE